MDKRTKREIRSMKWKIKKAKKERSAARHFKTLIEIVDNMTEQIAIIDNNKSLEIKCRIATQIIRKKLIILSKYSRELRRILLSLHKNRVMQKRIRKIKEMGEVYDKIFGVKEF